MTEKEQREIFARNFRKYVDESGKTQREIAKALGYSYTTVNTWYRGAALPNAAKIQTIADYFKIYKSDLLDDSTIVRTNGQDEVYKSGDAKNEIVVSDKDNRFSIHFRDGKTMSDTDKELLKEQIATTIDSFYKLRGIE